MPATTYHSIDVGGLLCLFDADGPCGNAVKEAFEDCDDGTTASVTDVPINGGNGSCSTPATRAVRRRPEYTVQFLRSLVQ